MTTVLHFNVETKISKYSGSYSGLKTGTINFVSHLPYYEGDVFSVNDGNYVIEKIIEHRKPKGSIWDYNDMFYKVQVTRK